MTTKTQMTQTQIDVLGTDIDNEGLDYFIESYTSLPYWEKEHGHLPQDVRYAWYQLAHALKHFRSVMKIHGVTKAQWP